MDPPYNDDELIMLLTIQQRSKITKAKEYDTEDVYGYINNRNFYVACRLQIRLIYDPSVWWFSFYTDYDHPNMEDISKYLLVMESLYFYKPGQYPYQLCSSLLEYPVPAYMYEHLLPEWIEYKLPEDMKRRASSRVFLLELIEKHTKYRLKRLPGYKTKCEWDTTPIYT